MTEVTKTKNCFLRLLSFTIIMFCDFIAKFLKLFMPLETVLLFNISTNRVNLSFICFFNLLL